MRRRIFPAAIRHLSPVEPGYPVRRAVPGKHCSATLGLAFLPGAKTKIYHGDTEARRKATPSSSTQRNRGSGGQSEEAQRRRTDENLCGGRRILTDNGIEKGERLRLAFVPGLISAAASFHFPARRPQGHHEETPFGIRMPGPRFLAEKTC